GMARLLLSGAGISLAMGGVAAFSVNMYSLPLDTFGGARAAFAVSILVAAYGAVQAVISPAFGALIDHYGFAPVCRITAFTPLAAFGVLKWSEGRRGLRSPAKASGRAPPVSVCRLKIATARKSISRAHTL